MAPLIRSALALCFVFFLGCSSEEPGSDQQQNDVVEDVAGEVESDVPAPGLAGAHPGGLAVGAGTTQSANFQLRFTLSAPLQGVTAQSDSFSVQPGVEVTGGQR